MEGEMRVQQHGWMEIYGRRARLILAGSSYGDPQREGTAKMRHSSMFMCVSVRVSRSVCVLSLKSTRV